MDISVIDAGPLRKTLTINYSSDELKACENQKITQYSSQMNLKGFRKGKTPKGLVKKRYGKAITEESADELIQKGLSEAMSKESLSPIGPMDDDEKSIDNGITYTTSFDVKPEFDLPDFSSFDLTSEAEPVDDDAVDKELDGFAQRSGEHAELEAEQCLEKDDSITLSGKITAGDEVVREIHDLNHLIGGYPLFGKKPEEVLELAASVKVGDALEFDTTLPERFKPEEWADKDAHVSVTVQSATRLKVAAIDDEFAKRMGVDSVDELRGRIRDSIDQRQQGELRQKQTDELIDAVIAASDFELPQTLLQNMIDENVQAAELEKERNESAPDVDKDAITENTEKMLRRHIIIDGVISKQDIQAQRSDLDSQLMMAAWQSGRKAEDIEKELHSSGQINQVLHEIVEGKAIEYMLNEALPVEDEESDDAAP
ncbi:MAG: trigger factor, partial [Planctomycetes bacterium]|nr:trigger factor [Planctomycetota bacterium]